MTFKKSILNKCNLVILLNKMFLIVTLKSFNLLKKIMSSRLLCTSIYFAFVKY